MKQQYQIPLLEVISLGGIIEPFCISGGEYSGTGPDPGETGFDNDSD